MNSMVYLLLTLLYCWAVAAKTNSGDVAVLRSLKKQWQNTPPNWVKKNPCGRKWEGIICNGSRVTAIILSGTDLTGSLPQDIVSLSELQTLDLSNNRGMMGHLPSNIGSLKNLVSLALVGCNFSGPIPESIGSLQRLTHLFLNSNHFTGPIPPSIGNLANLIWLDLSNNQLDGTIPVSNKTTPGLDMLLNAQHFHLGQNKLSGEIPRGLFSSKMALIHVILNDNQLSGSISDRLELVQTLEVIRLDSNFFSGLLPQKLNTLTRMSELYLANNNFSGPIPDLTGMNVLTYVDMSNNNFSASVPRWFKMLPSLTTLRMENTGLKGQLPEELFSLPQLQTVILKNNQLNGTVNIGTILSNYLQHIDLRNNSIEGFNSGDYGRTILLDGNPFCTKPEAARICKTAQPPSFSNFIPQLNCASLSCFSDQILGSNCKRPYLGSLVFRSFNFSDLKNLLYYTFLNTSLLPYVASRQVPIDKVCLVSSVIDTHGYLELNISFFPSDGAYFNRTEVSTIGTVLNNHIFPSPYGPYYFIDVTYAGFPGQSKHTGLIIGISICGFVLVLLTFSAGVYAYRLRKIADRATRLNYPFSSWNQGNLPQLGTRWFSFEDVRKSTDNFSDTSEIGVGGYGKVYKGKLDSGQLVAIKRAKQGSLQGALEFKTEIELLSRVHHKNVVNLVGFCYDRGEQMLVYEYVPNGSLRAALSGKSGVWLNWKRRLKVALGMARGLAYLHELADPPIIHRDIKSDNILLDDHLNAKVADFGLSILLSDDRDYVTTQVKGTMGYLDPEYYMTQLLTEKSDVYSFGVVMLELVTGRPPIEKNKYYIVKEVKEIINAGGNIYSVVDPAINVDTLTGVKESVNLAIRCLQDSGEDRPSMGEVVKEIETIIQASDLNIHVESPSTSGTYEVASDSGHPYNSVSFELDSRGSSSRLLR